jgi:hypothetical protein
MFGNLIADHDWYLIFGGLNFELDPSAGSTIDSVELYNWRNGQQCQLPNLKDSIYGPISVVFDGTPAYCGGHSNQELFKCWMLDKVTKTWVQVSRLI